jgi:hypothetical protein
MSQKVADANDLARAKVKDFPDFLAELDAGHPGGQVDVTEHEDRLAEVAELVGSIGEAFPRLAAVLPPNLARAVMTSVGRCLSLKTRLDRRVPLDVGTELGQKGAQIIGVPGLDGALDSLHVLLRHRPRSIPAYAGVCGPLPPGTGRTLPTRDQETDMATATQLGQTGLQGWREKVADGISQPVAKRAPLDEDQVRAIVGAAFFALAVSYVVKTISEATRQARQG